LVHCYENGPFWSVNKNHALKCFEKSSPQPPGNNVIIVDVMTICNHLIIKTTLIGEGSKGVRRGGEGRETKKMQKVHIKTENVPREFCQNCSY